MRAGLIILASVLFLACQHEHKTLENKPKNVSPNLTESKKSGETSTPDKTKLKTYNGKGVVTKINLELVSVELNHEEIEGLMPAMTMEFYVRNKSELESLQIGDKVEFVLEYDQGRETIISIKKIP
jgi:Cu/Ag efflux protein CusF